ncbi:FoF1 ATP synthase subunit delta/epsilon [[Mycoplasma] gypis]|uniref:F0F1 ATP synthase subunit epsilon n=1 Tax=[Mycoplasma] gypis TaxID=92404 RepID=A0ABZ2RW82_9BACT|nr:F0F1 ATP synthase subunit epsilon [[Mycoplasma] gypis]MBN0919377.1 F0F1 ATP synthase subunit epsilon [[Mycoplasma] gypis]
MTEAYLTITTPHGSFLETKTDVVTLKTTEGYIGIQANCLEFMAAIVSSKLYVNSQNNNQKIYYVNQGIVHSKGDRIDIIVNDISEQPLNLEPTFVPDESVKKYCFIEELNIKKALSKS